MPASSANGGDLEEPLINIAAGSATNENGTNTNAAAGDDENNQAANATATKKPNNLMAVFLAMVVIGLGNKLFQIFQAIPMHNYPYVFLEHAGIFVCNALHFSHSGLRFFFRV